MSKVVLVTGASSGIGAAIARVLVTQGHTVYGTGRQVELDSTIAGVRMIKMDIRVESDVRAAIEKVVARSGRLDVVVNNAGVGMIGSVELTSDEEVKSIFDTNVFGVLNVCRHAIPVLREGGGGYLINVTSMAGRIGLPFQGIYCATKSAVEGFSESMSMEVKQFNIHVVILEPGVFKTDMDRHRIEVVNANSAEYAELNQQVQDQVNSELRKAMMPSPLGYQVASIMLNPKPRLRYRSRKILHHMAIFLRWLLPDRIFELLMMRYFRIPNKRKQKNPIY
jgi:NAD(P)-dependent dehydrogenase (short-subunit alcohol dehydrogenase family)